MATKSRGRKKVVRKKQRTLSIVMPKGVIKDLARLIESGFEMTRIDFYASTKGKELSDRGGYLNFFGRQGKWKVVRE